MRRFVLIYILVCICCVTPLRSQQLSDFLSNARKGNSVAQYNAAQCYLHGWGTKPSVKDWHHMLRLSAEGGEGAARKALAQHYIDFAPEFASYWSGEAKTIPFDYRYRSHDEGCYYGEIHGGMPNGYGSYIWDEGIYHIGSWDDGERYGMGYTRFENVDLYCYLIDEAIGMGAIITRDPSHRLLGGCDAVCYVGYIEDGQPEGVGTLYDSSGEVCFYGNFHDGLPTSSANRELPNYHWSHETLDGGDSWEGETFDGARHGFGIYRWADGSWWCGYWENGLRSGIGLYVRRDRAIMSGNWSEGELQEQ